MGDSGLRSCVSALDAASEASKLPLLSVLVAAAVLGLEAGELLLEGMSVLGASVLEGVDTAPDEEADPPVLTLSVDAGASVPGV